MTTRRTQRPLAADTSESSAVAAWLGDLRLSEDDLRHARRWLLASGILALLAGAASIAVPIVATITTALFVGWILVFSGAVMAWHAFAQRASGRGWSRVAQALLTLLAGLYLVLVPAGGALSLTLLLVIWFAGIGGLELSVAYHLRGRPGAGWLILNGLVSIALAVLIAVDLPSSAAWAIGLLVGINLVFWGTRAVLAAGLLKRELAVVARSSPVGDSPLAGA